MFLRKFLLLIMSSVLLVALSCAEEPSNLSGVSSKISPSPRTFTTLAGDHLIPVNLTKETVTLRFDAKLKTATGSADLDFTVPEAGFPYFLLSSKIKILSLVDSNTGSALENARGFVPVTKFLYDYNYDVIPKHYAKKETAYAALRKTYPSGTTIKVHIDYELPSTVFNVSGNGKIDFFTSMDDAPSYFRNGAGGVRFFEQYAPANFEDDQFELALNLNISGTEMNHQVLSNGRVSNTGPSSWTINFPDTFTSSSFFIHLTGLKVVLAKEKIVGIKGAVTELKCYSVDVDQSTVQSCLDKLKQPDYFSELETTFGPYGYKSFLVNVIAEKSKKEGMEYAGAAVVREDSMVPLLNHELAHSWFGRGVMPADGGSGWLDEGIVYWRQYGYERRTDLYCGYGTMLIDHGDPFRRAFANKGYTLGAHVIQDLAWYLFPTKDSSTQMKDLLGKFYSINFGKTVTTATFRDFLHTETGKDMGPLFDRLIYGKRNAVPHVPGNRDSSCETELAPEAK